MIIGVPKEIKLSEYRVGITPSTASRLIEENHTVLVQKNSGEGICLLYTSPSPRDRTRSRMPSSA